MKRDLYRNQFSTVLNETIQISVNSLWGNRSQRDPGLFNGVVQGVRNRLGQADSLAGQLNREFYKIEVELVSLEKRGLGLPPEDPVPFMKPPKPQEPKPNHKFDPRRPYPTV